MQEIPYYQVNIKDDFWSPRLEMNATKALLHQWNQLEQSGCINNFRLIADPYAPGIRKGWFFADSDAYKWLEAAIIGYAQYPTHELKSRIEEFIALIQKTQQDDGYLYTYNQLIFPGSRWENLQIEHELYCHGHLIEAVVTHFQVTKETEFLEVGIKAANLIVTTFSGKGSLFTPGHEEIEIALLRLYEVSQNKLYLQLAYQFLNQRGRHDSLTFARHMFGENKRVDARTKQYRSIQQAYENSPSQQKSLSQVPPPNKIAPAPFSKTRFMMSALNGKYFQQHKPISNQTIPVGHAVRFAYLQTAAARYCRHDSESKWLQTLQQSWRHMVVKRMAVTGGIGSLPYSEGFGRDYELNPQSMYAETCAALGSMFWDWEMTLLTSEAAYADLFERQLYNASLVGIGQQGNCYLYNNPLESFSGMKRQPWFEIPCCPSNLSRTWGKLGGYLSSYTTNEIWIHQMISADLTIPFNSPINLHTESHLPWHGEFSIRVSLKQSQRFSLHLRIPSWAGKFRLLINNQEYQPLKQKPQARETTAHGYDPHSSYYESIVREWNNGDTIQLLMEMPIQINKVHPNVKSSRNKVSLSRGPLVYCLEGVDNPDLDFQNLTIVEPTLQNEFDPTFLGGIMVIKGKTNQDQPVRLIPYAWWANRDECPMTVFIKIAEN